MPCTCTGGACTDVAASLGTEDPSPELARAAEGESALGLVLSGAVDPDEVMWSLVVVGDDAEDPDGDPPADTPRVRSV